MECERYPLPVGKGLRHDQWRDYLRVIACPYRGKGSVERRSLFLSAILRLGGRSRSRPRQPRRWLLRLESGGKSLRFGYSFHFNRNRIHRSLDLSQPVTDRAQFARGDRAWFQPFSEQSDDGEPKYNGDYPRNHPGEHFVNDEIRIRRHCLPDLGRYLNQRLTAVHGFSA